MSHSASRFLLPLYLANGRLAGLSAYLFSAVNLGIMLGGVDLLIVLAPCRYIYCEFGHLHAIAGKHMVHSY